MPTKFIRSATIAALTAAMLWSLTPTTAQAQNNARLPSLNAFIGLMREGSEAELRGVYAPGLFAYRVVQQPGSRADYVAPIEGTLTQFGLATQYGSTGLLAHNNLAGNDFSLLERGQRLHLIYGNGRLETFVVSLILRYQALSPTSLKGDFVDLASGGLISTPQLLKRAYDRPGQVILQTCISFDQDPSWGRMFIIATQYRRNFRESTNEIY